MTTAQLIGLMNEQTLAAFCCDCITQLDTDGEPDDFQIETEAVLKIAESQLAVLIGRDNVPRAIEAALAAY